jgi:gamma-glutamyltranspeptidase/glutathione hydrolase
LTSLSTGSADHILGGVVSCVESLAAAAGAEILRAGGNAADAAVATAFAQGVVDPIYCGIAGGFHGLFWDEAAGDATVVSAGGYAPHKARADMWRPAGQTGATWKVENEQNSLGYQASMVPGFVRGAAEALSRFGSGRISWRQVIEPAIRLATDGFAVYPYLYRLWMERTEFMQGFIEGSHGPRILGFTEASRRIYLHEDGSVYEIGERLVQTDHARTLERLAQNGPGEFYEGLTAQMIAADFQQNGGLLDAADLRDYRPEIGAPLEGTFRGFRVITETNPSVGPVLLELLNVIEPWDATSPAWNSPEYLDRLARAMHLVFRDRLALLGDTRFVDVPLDRMTSKEYAASLRDLIESGTDLDPINAGDPDTRAGPEGTTHVTVVDGAHNGAAITHSLGMSSGVVTAGLGFLHNSHMEMFDPVPGSRNEIAPGKRPITGGGPVLLVKDGKLRVLIGSPAGARKVTGIAQAILNMFQFGMPIEEAVAVERIHVENEPRTVIVEPHFNPRTLVGLAALGQHVRFEWYTARLAGVAIDNDGQLRGGSDPRGDRGLEVVAGRTGDES